MTYRDSFEKCPRCAIELADARSARGCPSCRGLWVDEGVLTEMIQDMMPPGPLGRLQLAVLSSHEAPIGCPSCGERMEQTTLLRVPIDRCPKHGVWFDHGELGIALRRISEPGSPPALVEIPAFGPGGATGSPHRLDFEIAEPGQPRRMQRLDQEVIKIGRSEKSHIALVHDAAVARMHAVLEVTVDGVVLIDLGSAVGTLVNGQRVNKKQLHAGDVIQVGETTLAVTFAG